MESELIDAPFHYRQYFLGLKRTFILLKRTFFHHKKFHSYIEVAII